MACIDERDVHRQTRADIRGVTTAAAVRYSSPPARMQGILKEFFILPKFYPIPSTTVSCTTGDHALSFCTEGRGWGVDHAFFDEEDRLNCNRQATMGGLAVSPVGFKLLEYRLVECLPIGAPLRWWYCGVVMSRKATLGGRCDH